MGIGWLCYCPVCIQHCNCNPHVSLPYQNEKNSGQIRPRARTKEWRSNTTPCKNGAGPIATTTSPSRANSSTQLPSRDRARASESKGAVQRLAVGIDINIVSRAHRSSSGYRSTTPYLPIILRVRHPVRLRFAASRALMGELGCETSLAGACLYECASSCNLTGHDPGQTID